MNLNFSTKEKCLLRDLINIEKLKGAKTPL
jgi:hypothetical protein